MWVEQGIAEEPECPLNLMMVNDKCGMSFFPQVKAFLADPTAFVAVVAPAAAAETAAAPVAAKEEVKEESEESDDDMGFGLFD